MKSNYLKNFIESISDAKTAEERDLLWSKVSTPIYENISDDMDHCLITFLYRIDPEKQKQYGVTVYTVVTGLAGSSESKMKFVLAADIAYLTLKVPRTLRDTYSFLLIDQNTIQLQPDEDKSEHYPKLIGNTMKSDFLFGQLMEKGLVELDLRNPKKILYHQDLENPKLLYHQESVIACPDANTDESVEYTWQFNQSHYHALKNEKRFISDQVKFNESMLSTNPDYQNKVRRYWIYLPKGYDEKTETPYPWMLFTDGVTYALTAPAILDRLIQENKIPPCVAVFIDYAEDRLREYNGNEDFTNFLANDFIEILHSKNKLNISRNPTLTTIVGSSFGGYCAFYTALTRPAIFGNVIAQSPSFEMKKKDILKKLINQYAPLNHETNFIFQSGYYENIPLELLFEDGTTQAISSNEVCHSVFEYMASRSLKVELNEFMGGHKYVSWYSSLPGIFESLFLHQKNSMRLK